LVDLLVHQIAQSDDRHAQHEVQDARGLLIARVVDARAAQKDDDGDEGEQHGVEQRRVDASVEAHPDAVEADGERQQEKVRSDDVIPHDGKVYVAVCVLFG